MGKKNKYNAGTGAYKLLVGVPATIIGFTVDNGLELCRASDKLLPNDVGIDYGIKGARKFREVVADSSQFVFEGTAKEIDALAKAFK